MTVRVVHVASGREWRGGQRQVWLLARALAKTDAVTQVVVTGRGGELARRLVADRIPVVTPEWEGAFDPRALVATVRASARGSILHAHDGHALTLAGLASLVSGAHLIATRRVEFPLRRRGFWRRAERIIAISEAVRAVLLAAGFPPEQVTVVPSGISIDETTRITRQDPRAKLGLLRSTPLAVATGALERPKDHATLVRAAALTLGSSDLHWAIAGEGRLRGDLERLIDQLGLRRRVHLLGEVPDAARLVAAADLFVMSSIEEGLGTAVLDAMALGVPVVGTRAGGIPEMLEGGAGSLVPAGDPRALADAVLALLNDPAAREAQVARAREAVRRYGDERMAAGVLQVYRSVTSAH
jgi:glycosyltransferase involved in cell wall biosynthesis